MEENKSNKAFGYLLGFLLFFIAYPVGVFHAFNHHGTTHAAVSFLIFPYAWYLSAEQFWHTESQDKYNNIKVDGEKGAIDHLTTQCIANDAEFKRSRLTRNEYVRFCECYWARMVEEYPENEEEYFNAHGKNSPEFEKIAMEIINDCS